MTRSILVIEDDRLQAQDLKECLEKEGFRVGAVISTELEFRKRFPGFSADEYMLAIVDMMLRWTDPAPDMEMPDEAIMKEGFYVAGLRCCRKLTEKKIPCIVYTALERVHVPLREGDHFSVINKGLGTEALLSEIKRLSQARI